MRYVAASLKSGWTWWWGFGLLIALPALALAILGLRAVRSERIEQQQQVREQQTQIARLADASITNALSAIETTLLHSEAEKPQHAAEVTQAEAFVFYLDQQGALVFPRERLWFGEATQLRSAEWLPATQRLIEQAQAAEAQARLGAAVTTFHRIGVVEPKLRVWAEVCVTRIRQRNGQAAALNQLSDPTWSQALELTPTGLPVTLLLCAGAERVPLPERGRFTVLLERSLASLRGGRWWLSYDERRFYDDELCRLLNSVKPGQHIVEDARLGELAALKPLVHAARITPMGNHDAATRSYERAEKGSFLLLWSTAYPTRDVRYGLAFAQRQVTGLIETALAPLLSDQPFTVALRETNGETLWGRPPGNSQPTHAETLRSVSGWELVFSDFSQRGWLNQRELLWYGFILLLVVLLLVGLAMTARVVRREIELSRMQNEFIAAVSHEFKSPLTSIRLLMERLTSGRLRSVEAAHEYHTAIGRETDRLERLVNRLLEAQQLQAGHRQYTLAPVALTAIIQTATAQLRPQAEAKGIQLETRSAAALPTLPLDQAAITDAVENLLDNAIKYSSAGTHVTITAQATAQAVCIEVCDEGIGIEPDDLPRIFDRFYRGRQGDQQSVKGTGLGLALVKAAVEAHGGSVEVTSQPGQGSRFALHLPIKEVVEHGTDSGR